MITQRGLEKLKPQEKPYFLRSRSIKGFAVNVNPSGTIRYIVETKYNGKSLRKTIGAHPVMQLEEAEQEELRSHGSKEQNNLILSIVTHPITSYALKSF